jgi:hypothetical protein
MLIRRCHIWNISVRPSKWGIHHLYNHHIKIAKDRQTHIYIIFIYIYTKIDKVFWITTIHSSPSIWISGPGAKSQAAPSFAPGSLEIRWNILPYLMIILRICDTNFGEQRHMFTTDLLAHLAPFATGHIQRETGGHGTFRVYLGYSISHI